MLFNAFWNEIFIIRDKNINDDDNYYAYDNELDFEEIGFLLMPESPTTASIVLNLPTRIWTQGKGTKIFPLKQVLLHLPILVQTSKTSINYVSKIW